MTFSGIIDAIDGWLWGLPLIIILLATHIYCTVRSGFIQRYIGRGIKLSVTPDPDGEGEVSQFGALTTALAATIGTGNIVGVATAIVSGGPGAVFWMWITGVLGIATKYFETHMSVKYRVQTKDGRMIGGAMFALQRGLNMKWLGVIFAALGAIAAFGIGCATQANSISAAMGQNFGVNPILTGIVVAVLTAVVIIGGVKAITKVTEKLVPFMAIAYVIGALVIVICNAGQIGPVFASIFKGAFGMKAVGGGIVGSGVAMAVQWGMKRGVFSNEAGLGSSVMVHSCSNVREPVVQGMWGIFEVFADTIIVCTLTALAILSSGMVDLNTGAVISKASSTALVSEAFSTVFGVWGARFIAVAILLFAFSTVLGWSQYGTKGFEYLFGTKAVKVYQVIFVIFILVGATMNLSLAWDLSDTFNGLMAIPNLIGVIALNGTVMRITKNYVDRKIKGKNVKPMFSAFEDIQKMQEAAEEAAARK